LFHVGHVDFLEKVSQEGDFIIVGLHVDSVVNRYKGKIPLQKCNIVLFIAIKSLLLHAMCHI